MSVSRETEERLRTFAAMLRQWNKSINLVGPATLDDLDERHLKDSLQLLDIQQPKSGLWVDLGSGGGLPAIPIACAAADHIPDLRFVLVESDRKKATFLRQAISRLGLRAQVEEQRIEQLPPQHGTTVSARALAPLPRLLSYVHRHIGPEGTALLHKGKSWRDEVAVAQKQWRFDMITHESVTSDQGVVLELRNLRAA